METKDFSLAPFLHPPAIVHRSIVICVPRDWLQTTCSVTATSWIYCKSTVILQQMMRKTEIYCSIGISLDLSKAFDMVNHDILFDKLKHDGIHGFGVRKGQKLFLGQETNFQLQHS